MRTDFLTTILCFSAASLLSVSCKDFSIKPLDYANAENWMIQSPIEHEVDLFFIYPTSVDENCTSFVSPVDSAMKANAYYAYLQNAECFSGYTNVFVPYYRQLSLVGLTDDKTPDGIIQNDRENEPWCDIKAALDYYFSEINTDRPVLFASHSQGSAVMHIVMDTYLKEHPELKSRIVAVYAIGYQITPEWCEEIGIPFAAGEEDTGVILTWNTEGPGVTANNTVFCNSLGINPLNWKTDTTYAGIELNKGSLAASEDGRLVEVPGRADAQFCPERGTIICTTDTNWLPTNPLFGEKSFHFEDGALFYQNMKENGRKRIAAYLEKSTGELYIHYTPEELDPKTETLITFLTTCHMFPETAEELDSTVKLFSGYSYEEYSAVYPPFADEYQLDSILDVNGYKTLVLTYKGNGDNNQPKANLIYTHGGGFMFNMNNNHRDICQRLAERMNVTVYMPLYPLAPNYYVQTTMDMLIDLYKKVSAEGKPVYIMGDSAGGNITLAFGLYLKSLGEKLPDAIFVISPICDYSCSNPQLPEYNKKDILLSELTLEPSALWKPEDMPYTDPLVSPQFGDWTGMPQTFFFAGTDESFYPEIMETARNMKNAGMRVGVLVGNHLFHIAPIMPIPVMDQYIDEITEFLYGARK